MREDSDCICIGTHVVAVVDSTRSGSQSIYHIKFEILVDSSSNSK